MPGPFLWGWQAVTEVYYEAECLSNDCGMQCVAVSHTFDPSNCSRRGTTGVSLNLSSGPSFGLPCVYHLYCSEASTSHPWVG